MLPPSSDSFIVAQMGVWDELLWAEWEQQADFRDGLRREDFSDQVLAGQFFLFKPRVSWTQTRSQNTSSSSDFVSLCIEPTSSLLLSQMCRHSLQNQPFCAWQGSSLNYTLPVCPVQAFNFSSNAPDKLESPLGLELIISSLLPWGCLVSWHYLKD